jgi:hypothetical protein
LEKLKRLEMKKMSEIWTTGDIHGDPSRLRKANFPEQKEFEGGQDENFVVISGDFGLVWNYAGENKNYWTTVIDKKGNIIFILILPCLSQ